MRVNYLPQQPHPAISYFRVGKLLHGALLLFLLESYVYWVFLSRSLEAGDIFWIAFWVWSFLFSFIHIFLVIMDGWSRFQDYKRAKDLFFTHGFNPRIANMYLGSKCQRAAALVAAQELGISDEVKHYYAGKGVKWYHYVPYFMVKDPLFLIRKSFWERTFLEKRYVPRYDFRKLQPSTFS